MLFAGLLVGAVVDVATKKIPNWLTFSLLVLGLALSTTHGIGLGAAAIGATVAFVSHFALWQLQLEGAGDAKLMMAVGAFTGWEVMIEATLWRYVLLIPYAVITITVLGRWGAFKEAMSWTLRRTAGKDVGERPEATYMPFGPLLAVAVPIALYTSYLEFF